MQWVSMDEQLIGKGQVMLGRHCLHQVNYAQHHAEAQGSQKGSRLHS